MGQETGLCTENQRSSIHRAHVSFSGASGLQWGLWALLEALGSVRGSGATLRACGLHCGLWAAHMAKGVRATVVEMLQTHRGLDAKAAAELVATWERKGKYLQDIWS